MRCLGLLDKMLVQVKHPATLYKNLAYDDGKELVDRNLSVYEELYGAPWLYVLIHANPRFNQMMALCFGFCFWPYFWGLSVGL